MKAQHKKKAKMNIPMCIACVLFCLTLITIHLTSGLYARYVTTDSAQDSARVAKFEVTVPNQFFSQELVVALQPGTLKTSIDVSNKSEVAVNYTITITNVTQNIPLQFQIGEGAVQADECTATYSMPVNSHGEYSLKIVWPKEGALAYMGMVDLIQITVKAEQID